MVCTAVWTGSCDTMESDIGMLFTEIELSIERLWENHGLCIANLCPTSSISSPNLSISETLEHFTSSGFVSRTSKSFVILSNQEEVLVFALVLLAFSVFLLLFIELDKQLDEKDLKPWSSLIARKCFHISHLKMTVPALIRQTIVSLLMSDKYSSITISFIIGKTTFWNNVMLIKISNFLSSKNWIPL